tara:strand:+ start:1022 stop:1405 length:384 start_codon:yes stop_codon:yes gene_type:complete
LKITNLKKMSDKPYNLEERTYLFADSVRELVYSLQKSVVNIEDGKQIVRSSGSVAANYIEANEHLSDKDFDFRIKICRKEAKESCLWLKLLQNDFNKKYQNELVELMEEANELKKIFSSIIEKRKKR